MKTGRLITPLLLSITALLSLWFSFHLEPVEAVAIDGIALISVDTTVDDNIQNGNCTLREAIIAANSGSPIDDCSAGGPVTEIYMPSGIYSLTISGTDEDAAATGDLDLDRKGTIRIFGTGPRDTIIDGGGLDRVFHVIIGDIELHSLTIQNGTTVPDSVSTGSGGGIAISTDSALTISDVHVTKNTANNNGGGIWITGTSILYANASLIDHNATSPLNGGAGGGIYIGSSINIADLQNTTISSNTAEVGGGYQNFGLSYLINATIYDNSAQLSRGGISNVGTVTFTNSLIGGNSAPVSPDCGGTYDSLDYNLIEDTSGCTIIGATANNITGSDPLLDTLANNGGNTDTHALLDGSPAIDNGDCPSALPVDQRDVSRPQGLGCDIGAYEKEQLSVYIFSSGDGCH